jgi:hypothetical protein
MSAPEQPERRLGGEEQPDPDGSPEAGGQPFEEDDLNDCNDWEFLP